MATLEHIFDTVVRLANSLTGSPSGVAVALAIVPILIALVLIVLVTAKRSCQTRTIIVSLGAAMLFGGLSIAALYLTTGPELAKKTALVDALQADNRNLAAQVLSLKRDLKTRNLIAVAVNRQLQALIEARQSCAAYEETGYKDAKYAHRCRAAVEGYLALLQKGLAAERALHAALNSVNGELVLAGPPRLDFPRMTALLGNLLQTFPGKSSEVLAAFQDYARGPVIVRTKP